MLRGRVHRVGGHSHEVERAQRLDGAPRVGVGDDDVDAAGIERAHGIGTARQHGLDDGGVVAGRLPALRPGPKREAVGADGPFLHLGIQPEFGHVQQVDIVAHALGRAHAQIPAGAVDVAADGEEAVVGAERLHAGAEGVDAVPADEGGGPVGIHAGGGGDLLGGNAGEPFRNRRRKLRRARRQLLEAMAPALDERLVVAVLTDQHVHKSQRRARHPCRCAERATDRPSAPPASAWDRSR